MATTYDIWFGLPGQMALISAGQIATSVIPPIPLEHDTTYNWAVDTTVDDGEPVIGDTWVFTTLALTPPKVSVHPVTGFITGSNGMVTLRRLVVACDNKIYYET
jgi:hypothetical protein